MTCVYFMSENPRVWTPRVWAPTTAHTYPVMSRPYLPPNFRQHGLPRRRILHDIHRNVSSGTPSVMARRSTMFSLVTAIKNRSETKVARAALQYQSGMRVSGGSFAKTLKNMVWNKPYIFIPWHSSAHTLGLDSPFGFFPARNIGILLRSLRKYIVSGKTGYKLWNSGKNNR